MDGQTLPLDRLPAGCKMLLAGSDWSSAFAQAAAILFASDARAQHSALDSSIVQKPFH
jgi:hypothetical protein